LADSNSRKNIHATAAKAATAETTALNYITEDIIDIQASKIHKHRLFLTQCNNNQICVILMMTKILCQHLCNSAFGLLCIFSENDGKGASINPICYSIIDLKNVLRFFKGS
jgi:hypothetical protein